MKKMSLVLLASMLLLPALSFAVNPQAPASWIAFMKAENAKRLVFNKQMMADRIAFLNANPDVKAYFDQMRATGQARFAAWKAAHHK